MRSFPIFISSPLSILSSFPPFLFYQSSFTPFQTHLHFSSSSSFPLFITLYPSFVLSFPPFFICYVSAFHFILIPPFSLPLFPSSRFARSYLSFFFAPISVFPFLRISFLLIYLDFHSIPSVLLPAIIYFLFPLISFSHFYQFSSIYYFFIFFIRPFLIFPSLFFI